MGLGGNPPRDAFLLGLPLMAQMVDPGWIPGWEDLLEKGMATHSSILPWSISLTEDTVHGVAKNHTGLSN